MRIEASGPTLEFPFRCACCGGPPDSTLPVPTRTIHGVNIVRTKANTWRIPYCSACIKHVDAGRAASRAANWTICGALVAGVFAGYGVSGWLGWPLAVVGVAAAQVIYGRLTTRAENLCSSNCVSVREAVALLRCLGTANSFDFDSDGYALDFMVANQSKLLNLSKESSQLLAECGHESSPGVVVQRERES